MDNNKFDHFDFLMLCNHYPIDLDAVDEMLLRDINFDKTCFEIGHDFLSELMEYIADGIDKARYDGNESADDRYMYEVLLRIFQKGYSFPNEEVLKECLWQLFHSNRDEYMLKILDMFMETKEMKKWMLKLKYVYESKNIDYTLGIKIKDVKENVQEQILNMNFTEFETQLLNRIRFYPDDGTEVHECDYKYSFKDLTLDELSYIRENAVFSGILNFLFTMIEGRN